MARDTPPATAACDETRLASRRRNIIYDYALEFMSFGLKQAAACIFAGSFLLLLVISAQVRIPGLYRYDFLFLGAIVIQLILIACRLESWREVAVLSLFHLLGLGLEIFKTSPTIASWQYPGPAYFRIATVPLYSGFMYAAIASYVMQAWRLLRLRLVEAPPPWVGFCLSALIYGNFFANHYLPDQRWPIISILCLFYGRTMVCFMPLNRERRMPLVLSFVLIGLFVWIAENIGTYFGGWIYPAQMRHWAIVGPNKISSWMLMVVIAVLIVAALKRSGSATHQAKVTADADISSKHKPVR
ncbi:MAG TPA: DUF817 domain-containing protein [Dongiaceae bacterium]|nr:DUF817 domain-containing protein [Dongiaceae bacterium]